MNHGLLLQDPNGTTREINDLDTRSVRRARALLLFGRKKERREREEAIGGNKRWKGRRGASSKILRGGRVGLGRVKGSIAQIARGKMRRAHELVYAINFEKGRLLGC